MALENVKNADDPAQDLATILDQLHKVGPNSSEVLERISFYKEFHSDIFSEFEENILSALGVFYKIKEPKNLYSFLMSGFGIQHNNHYGSFLTPVQASIRRAVDGYQYTSISAPTSAGKSYSIRDWIAGSDGDAVVIVPSRALIAEYMSSMKRRFDGDKRVMVSSFVDLIYKSRKLRRIFILTPERSKDLYKFRDVLNIDVFFFDEAQISEEVKRGLVFDVMVRRIKQHFPHSKMVFAHPFIENPEAQFSKHNMEASNCFAMPYSYGSVGKLCVFKHKNGKSYYFSPHLEGGHLIKNCVEFKDSFKDFALSGEHSLLVYVSKNSIYKGDFLEGFEEYIESLPEISNIEGKVIIERIEHLLGADQTSHHSKLVDLLKKGVVIHHGSIPLEVRFLIEDFVRGDHTTLCFATSTLAQGINMPFDIVWLDNNRFNGTEDERALAFKNLIGRSGRLTSDEKFDYGYVYTLNPKLFSERINLTFSLAPTSLIETLEIDDSEDDRNELIDAIQNNTFDDDKNIPQSKVERLSQDEVLNYAEAFLSIIYGDGDNIKSNIGGAIKEQQRRNAQYYLRVIYEFSLGRTLYDGELAVFEHAISIFFHMIQGRSFREIVGIRYSYVSDRDNKNNGKARFSQPADKLPNSQGKKKYSIYEVNTLATRVSYDRIVFDTYDYMDQVLSYCLSDVFIAAFQIYAESRIDDRANKAIELFRYGTNDTTHILLLLQGLQW